MRLFDFGVSFDINIKNQNKILKRITSPNSRKLGRQTIAFLNQPRIMGRAAIVSKKEKEGPMGEYFNDVLADVKLGEKSFEKAEVMLFAQAFNKALNNARIDASDIDILLSGDLLNQIISANYMARLYDIPFFGIYGACSNMTEGLIIGGMMLDAGFADYAACVTGSHFATAERQFRGPLELGSQRHRYSQHTVTGAGCTIIGLIENGVKITHATIGKVEDYGVTDPANMGAAMAPAAMSTLTQFFKDTQTFPDDYDLIVTGDLGKLGEDILRKLMREQNYPLGQNYMDCGASIYHHDQHTSEGGSGAGCCATILNTYILDKMEQGTYKKVLFVATGALLSLITPQQKESIPAVAHLILLES